MLTGVYFHPHLWNLIMWDSHSLVWIKSFIGLSISRRIGWDMVWTFTIKPPISCLSHLNQLESKEHCVFEVRPPLFWLSHLTVKWSPHNFACSWQMFFFLFLSFPQHFPLITLICFQAIISYFIILLFLVFDNQFQKLNLPVHPSFPCSKSGICCSFISHPSLTSKKLQQFPCVGY